MAAGESFAQSLLEIAAAQAGRKHALLEPINDDLRLRAAVQQITLNGGPLARPAAGPAA